MHIALHLRFAASSLATVLGLTASNAAWAEPARTMARGDSMAVASTVNSFHKALAVTVEGSTASTVGTSTTKGDNKGRQINSVGVETMVLTKTAAGWRIRSIHWSSHAQRSPAGKD